jgi:hypothetical protein
MRILYLIILCTFLFALSGMSYGLSVGDRAPLFNAESTSGTISLQSYLGQKHVVLVFYYADFSPV